MNVHLNFSEILNGIHHMKMPFILWVIPVALLLALFVRRKKFLVSSVSLFSALPSSRWRRTRNRIRWAAPGLIMFLAFVMLVVALAEPYSQHIHPVVRVIEGAPVTVAELAGAPWPGVAAEVAPAGTLHEELSPT